MSTSDMTDDQHEELPSGLTDDEERIQDYLERPWHQLTVGPGSRQARSGLRIVLERAAEAGRLDEVVNLRPPVAFLVDVAQPGWTVVLRDLSPDIDADAHRTAFSVRIVVLSPRAVHNQYYVAGVIAHELGHAFHHHRGHGSFQDECAADDKAREWGCGRFLSDGLQQDILEVQMRNEIRAELALPTLTQRDRQILEEKFAKAKMPVPDIAEIASE